MGGIWDEPYYVVVEIENRQCKILEILRKFGIRQFKVVDIRGLKEGLTRHLVELPLRSVDELVRASIAKRGINRSSVWFESEGCGVCNAILSCGSFLVSGRSVQNFTFIYSFVTPSFEAYRRVIEELRSKEVNLRILKIKKFKPSGRVLTEKQERALWLALRMGFFDYPKKIDTVELSRILGISPSTLSEVIRRGVRRLLEYYFETP